MPLHGDDFGSTKTCSDRNLRVKGAGDRAGRLRSLPRSSLWMQREAEGGKGCLENAACPRSSSRMASLSQPGSLLLLLLCTSLLMSNTFSL